MIGQAIKQMLLLECRLAWQDPVAWMLPFLFSIITLSLYAIVLSPQPNVLVQVVAIASWVSIIFANLLAQDRLLRRDAMAGALSNWLLSVWSLPLLMLLKTMMHWLLTVLPLIILVVLFSGALGLPSYAAWALLISLLLGTPILCLLSQVVGMLTLSVQNGGLLLALLLLPLYVPILIFANGMVQLAMQQQPFWATALLLAGLLLLSLCLLPFAIAAAVRVALSQ